MLTDEEKTRIRTEEIFRLEVRQELAASEPRRPLRERFWSLLNSSFALWFLSSVLLAGLTTAFTRYQTSHDQKTRKDELERRLDTEISSRISSAMARLRIDKEEIERGESYPKPQAIYGGAASYLDNFFITDPSNRSDWSIYPEYQKRTFRSLVFELRTVVESSERLELSNALASYEQLLDLGSIKNSTGGRTTGQQRQESLQAVGNTVDLLDHRLTKARWRSQMAALPAERGR